MPTRRRKRHTPEQIVRKRRDADTMLNTGKDEPTVLHASEISPSAYERLRKWAQPEGWSGFMKVEESKTPKCEIAETRHR